jgi:rod shape determining protein RodA
LTQLASTARVASFARGAGARTRLTATGLRSDARPLHLAPVNWHNVGWLCVLAALGLSVIGILAISTTEPAYAIRQIAHLCVGLLAATVVALPHYRWLERAIVPLTIAALGLLIFVLIPFVPEIIVRPRNGARRWINLGVTDFQPSELAKIAYILGVASYLRVKQNYRTFIGVLRPLALSLVPIGLILFEPNLGMALLFLPTLFAMLIAAGAKIKHLAIIIIIGLSIAPLSYPFLWPHQRDRIDALIAQVRGDPRYEKDIGYQGSRAMTLAGAGGFFGVGASKAANLIHYNHLPEEHNDMVFAVVACRWGLMGAIVAWGMFGVFAAGGLLTAALCKDPFGRLVAVGIIAALMAQMAINTGMTVGLLPITGLPLPFVSYGGSSLVATWLMVGLLFNIAMRRSKYLARQSFEFDRSRADGD